MQQREELWHGRLAWLLQEESQVAVSGLQGVDVLDRRVQVGNEHLLGGGVLEEGVKDLHQSDVLVAGDVQVSLDIFSEVQVVVVLRDYII